MPTSRSLLAVLIAVAAAASAPAASAQCAPDSFEPNDSCATAWPLSPGSWTNLSVNGYSAPGGLKEDFYELTIGVGEEMTLDIQWDSADGHLQLWLYDDGVCTTGFIDADTQGFGTADVAYNNITATPQTLVLKVRSLTPAATCVSYDMDYVVNTNPCVSALDDGFEDNDDCMSAALLPLGTTTGLTVFGSNSTHGLDEDWFRVSGIPAGDVLTVQMTYTHSNGDLALALYDAPCAASATKFSNYQFGVETLEIKNETGATQDYWVEIQAYDFNYDCGTYDLLVTSAPDPCDSTADDGFAPNDWCGSPANVTAGTHAGLIAFKSAPDYFRVNVPAGKRLTVDALFPHAGGNLDLEIWDANCNTMLDDSTSYTDDETVFTVNNGTAAADYIVLVEVASDLPTCNTYDMVVTVVDDPCLTGADDGFAPNQSCGSGPELANGAYAGLFVSKFAEDHFDVRVAPGETITVQVDCVAAAGNVSAFLYDPLVSACDQLSDLARADSYGDSKSFSYTNTEAIERTYELEVMIRPWVAEDCNDYDLLISGVLGQPGAPFCFGDGTGTPCPCANESVAGAGEGCQNSQGHGAVLSATGSNLVASDDVTFSIAQARPHQPSMLVQGASSVAVPFKDGVLCMGNPTERLEIIGLDAAGAGSSTVSIVTEGFVSPGQTRYYQAWYRDPALSPCGSGSNFSQGLEIPWQ